MENASKALIMAAGILVGILILSLFAYEMIQISNTGKAYQEQIDQEEITEFNAQFYKYENKALSAQEVATIVNYVTEWNLKNESYQIEITTGIASLKNVIVYKTGTIEDFLNEGDNYTKYYSLSVLGLNDETGRINKIQIKEKT